MALADFNAYRDALGQQPELTDINFASLVTVAGRPYDLWTTAVPAGVAPTTAAVPTNATLGAIGQQNGGSGALVILSSRMSAAYPGQYIIVDRLSHQGGLSGTVTTAQTTNLPTSALTRYTSGEGVMIGITIYTLIGTTATTISASYTNQAGTSGQTTPLVVFGGTAFREAGRMILLPLAAGDTGARAVASVTVTASTTTAGAFGVTLFKPLYSVLVSDMSGVSQGGFVTGSNFGGIPEIVDNACLSTVYISAGINAQGSGALKIAEV